MSHPQQTATPPVPVGGRPPAPAVVAAVRGSLRAVADRPVELAEAFYEHLFSMAPQVRGMFPADLSGQMQKMTDVLLVAIGGLDAPDTAELEATLRRMGHEHRVRYGVEAAHYGYIGHALTRAVRDVTGPTYSGSLSSAWIAVQNYVSAHMIAGALAGADEPAGPEPVVELPGQRDPAGRHELAPS